MQKDDIYLGCGIRLWFSRLVGPNLTKDGIYYAPYLKGCSSRDRGDVDLPADQVWQRWSLRDCLILIHLMEVAKEIGLE